MNARVAVVVFPGTNSEDETLRALLAVGLDAELVHWSRGAAGLRPFDAYVLPGGFSYEDRVRAGAVAAHDEVMDAVIAGAGQGKFVLGICNGAQTLLEAGLVPGTGPLRRPTAAFAPNAGGKFLSVRVHVRLAVPPARLPILAGLPAGSVIPAWASHGEGRLAAAPDELDRLRAGWALGVRLRRRARRARPGPERLGPRRGRPGQPRRDGPGNHAAPGARRLDLHAPQRRPGKACRPRAHRRHVGAVGRNHVFPGLRGRAGNAGRHAMTAAVERSYVVSLIIPDNEAYTALTALARIGLPVAALERADVWVARVDPQKISTLDGALATIETIYNPNKHRLEIRDGARPRPGEVWVTAADETPAITVAGRSVDGLVDIVRRTSWRLLDEQGRSVPAAILDRATESFLCNPAFQKAIIYDDGR